MSPASIWAFEEGQPASDAVLLGFVQVDGDSYGVVGLQ
jgi:hypothetical protein